MTVLFQERFDCRHGDLPCGWFVERNSDLAASGIRRGEGCIELLSAGNKFIPVIPDVHDCTVDFKVGVNYLMGKSFGFYVCFRYDALLRRGEAIRVRCSEEAAKLTIDYGRFLANRFEVLETRELPSPEAKKLDRPFKVQLDVCGKLLRVTVAGCITEFAIPSGSVGKVALARMHFFDVMKILSFRITTNEKTTARSSRSFTVPIAQQATMYPLFCDVSLLDFGDCMEARLSFRGGVAETEPGEGNYHVARADLFNRPFLKVITANAMEEYVVYDEEFVNVVKHLVPDYFYKVLHKRAPWPLKRSVRFIKPYGAFDLAVGFESFCHSTMRNYAQAPTETMFTLAGKILHSGVGISDGKVVATFLSNPKKQFASRLPKKDPRLKVDGLEDLFGVRDTGKDASVTQVIAVGDFMEDFDGERLEFCTEPHCKGHYAANGCKVLLEGKTDTATMPVLTIKENGAAKAVLFTVPPQLVRPDELHERLEYARDSISRFINAAAQTVMGMLAKPEVTVNGGRLIAYHSTNGDDVIIMENPDKRETVTIDMTISELTSKPIITFWDKPYFVVSKDKNALQLRVRLPKEECAVIVIK